MTPDELAAIEARANAATPGPWTVEEDGNWVYGKGGELADIFGGNMRSDTAFIAAARQDVPALVAEVRRLQAKCGESPVPVGQPRAIHLAGRNLITGKAVPCGGTIYWSDIVEPYDSLFACQRCGAGWYMRAEDFRRMVTTQAHEFVPLAAEVSP